VNYLSVHLFSRAECTDSS